MNRWWTALNLLASAALAAGICLRGFRASAADDEPRSMWTPAAMTCRGSERLTARAEFVIETSGAWHLRVEFCSPPGPGPWTCADERAPEFESIAGEPRRLCAAR